MRRLVFLFVIVLGAALWSGTAGACGGFFCQNQPVDQTGERIVFTVNDDGTMTALIEILYVGSADDFSWILPVPEAISADALAVPEDGDLVFDELHAATDVRVIAPEPPECALQFRAMAATADSADGGVDVFASGEIGPFGFDIVGSEDRDALVQWLRDNDYRVTPEMEPLIDVYVQDRFAFIAMRLLDGETAESITPIEVTYPSTEPMVPLRLTAVAAQPNMPVWVWIMADAQAVPANYAHMEIATEEITFNPFGGNDYTFLVQQRANAFDGHAFITEFAGPVDSLELTHPWLVEMARSHPYLTRVNTYIDPAEMTIDPVFGFDADRPDVSNVRDATGLEGLYGCERTDDPGILDRLFGGDSDAVDPMAGTGRVVAFTPQGADSGPVDEAATEEPTIAAADEDGQITLPDASVEATDDPFGRTALLAGAGTLVLLVGIGGFALTRRRSSAGG